MVRLKRRAVLLAKTESVYGTDPTPTVSANAILTIDVNVKENFDPIERDVQILSLTRKQTIGAKRFVEITFQTELYGSGSVALPPRIGALLKASAMSETINSGTSVVYAPASTSLSSVTIWVELDGVLHKMNGCVGTYKINAEAGKQAMIDWTFNGIYNAPTDASLGAPTFESTVNLPPLVKSAGLTLNSVALVVNAFTLDMGNTIAQRPSVNAAFAIAGFHITDRKPVATIDPESELIATYDYRTDILTTPRNLHLNIGSTAGNRVLVNIPRFNTTDIEYGDREMTLIETITGQCSDGGSGNDEVTFTFT
jgi:hypothetical protein